MSGVQDVGARVEELLDVLRSGAARDAAPAAEELVRLLVGLYGDGLSHIVAALREQGQPGVAMLHKLAEDPLVESLLLLHDLHPLDVDARVQRALDRVRPYLGSHAGGVEYLGVHDGVARLRLEGSCHGCPSSTVTVQLAIEGAVQQAAPEVTEVVVEGMTAPPPGPKLLQIGRQPGRRGRRRRGERRRLGDPAQHRAAEFPAGHRPGGRHHRAAVLGARHPLRLPRCVRGLRILAGRRDARPRAAELPGLRDALQRAAGRAAAWTTRPCTSSRCRCSPTARASASRCQNRSARERGPAPVRGRRSRETAAGQASRPGQPAEAAPGRGGRRQAPEEKCEFCAATIPADHGHVADLESSTLMCACRACYLLFTHSGAGQTRPQDPQPGEDRRMGRARYRAIPDRYRSDPGHPLTPAEWDALEIPVGLAFFLRSSAGGDTTGFYPSPAGATECRLDLEAWDRIAEGHPLVASAAADVEAILISRGERDQGAVEMFLVPIDACYELAGRMRLLWRGFDGGAEARQSIAVFLDRVRARSRDLSQEP